MGLVFGDEFAFAPIGAATDNPLKVRGCQGSPDATREASMPFAGLHFQGIYGCHPGACFQDLFDRLDRGSLKGPASITQ